MSVDKRNSAGASTTQANFNKIEFEATAAQTEFTLDFMLTAKSVVLQNGAVVPSTDYSGVGTYTLTLTTPANEFDNIIVIG